MKLTGKKATFLELVRENAKAPPPPPPRDRRQRQTQPPPTPENLQPQQQQPIPPPKPERLQEQQEEVQAPRQRRNAVRLNEQESQQLQEELHKQEKREKRKAIQFDPKEIERMQQEIRVVQRRDELFEQDKEQERQNAERAKQVLEKAMESEKDPAKAVSKEFANDRKFQKRLAAEKKKVELLEQQQRAALINKVATTGQVLIKYAGAGGTVVSISLTLAGVSTLSAISGPAAPIVAAVGLLNLAVGVFIGILQKRKKWGAELHKTAVERLTEVAKEKLYALKMSSLKKKGVTSLQARSDYFRELEKKLEQISSLVNTFHQRCDEAMADAQIASFAYYQAIAKCDEMCKQLSGKTINPEDKEQVITQAARLTSLCDALEKYRQEHVFGGLQEDMETRGFNTLKDIYPERQRLQNELLRVDSDTWFDTMFNAMAGLGAPGEGPGKFEQFVQEHGEAVNRTGAILDTMVTLAMPVEQTVEAILLLIESFSGNVSKLATVVTTVISAVTGIISIASAASGDAKVYAEDKETLNKLLSYYDKGNLAVLEEKKDRSPEDHGKWREKAEEMLKRYETEFGRCESRVNGVQERIQRWVDQARERRENVVLQLEEKAQLVERQTAQVKDKLPLLVDLVRNPQTDEKTKSFYILAISKATADQSEADICRADSAKAVDQIDDALRLMEAQLLEIIQSAQTLKLDEKKQRMEDLRFRLELDKRTAPRTLDEIVSDAIEGRVDRPTTMPTFYKVMRILKHKAQDIAVGGPLYPVLEGMVNLVQFIQEKRQEPDYKDWKSAKGPLDAVGVHLGKLELAALESNKDSSPEARLAWRNKAEIEATRIESRLNFARGEMEKAAGPFLQEEEKIAGQELLYRPGLMETISKAEKAVAAANEGIKLGEDELKTNTSLDSKMRQELNTEINKLRRDLPGLQEEERKLKQTLTNLDFVLNEARKPLKLMMAEYHNAQEYLKEKQDRIDKLRKQLEVDAKLQEFKKRHEELGVEAEFEDALSGEEAPETLEPSNSAKAIKVMKGLAKYSFPPLAIVFLAGEATSRIRKALATPVEEKLAKKAKEQLKSAVKELKKLNKAIATIEQKPKKGAPKVIQILWKQLAAEEEKLQGAMRDSEASSAPLRESERTLEQMIAKYYDPHKAKMELQAKELVNLKEEVRLGDQVMQLPGIEEDVLESLQEDMQRAKEELSRVQEEARANADAMVRLKDVISEMREKVGPGLKAADAFLTNEVGPAVKELKELENRLTTFESRR